MIVKEIETFTQLENCEFYDVKENHIPFEMVMKRCMHWEVYSATSKNHVKIIPSEITCKKFFSDLKGTVLAKGKPLGLYTTESIVSIFDDYIPTEIIRAYMFGCAKYGITQREYPYGYKGNNPMWVIE